MDVQRFQDLSTYIMSAAACVDGIRNFARVLQVILVDATSNCT